MRLFPRHESVLKSRRQMLATAGRATVCAGVAGLLTLGGLTASETARAADESKSYIMATASTGGTYYPVGVAISTLTKVKLEPKQKISLNAVSSAGSGENIKLLRENEAQFAILQGLYGAYAWSGTGPLEKDGKQENLRSVSMLWQNVEHFVMKKRDAKTGTIDDFMTLEGKKVSLGSRNSGTLGSNNQILKGFGIDDTESYFDLAYMGYGASADAYQNGQIDAMSIPAGVPVSAITRAFASMEGQLVILGFDEAAIKKANGVYEDLWTAYPIAAGTYPGQDKDVTTIAQPNFLATRADVDEESVYQITKTMYENLLWLPPLMQANYDCLGERSSAVFCQAFFCGIFREPLAGMVISGSGPDLTCELCGSGLSTGFPDPDLFDPVPISILVALHLPFFRLQADMAWTGSL